MIFQVEEQENQSSIITDNYNALAAAIDFVQTSVQHIAIACIYRWNLKDIANFKRIKHIYIAIEKVNEGTNSYTVYL